MNKILEIYDKPIWDDEYVETIKSKLLDFTLVLDKKWTENKRTYDRFLEKNREWIQRDFILPSENKNICTTS